MARRKLQQPKHKPQQEDVNKKAIYITGGIFVGIVVLLSVLLALD
ncbi:hypothetical protein [Marinicrinis lubricantis]|uniref:Uncharacterized protein n=1 Tax=Marinicrinis lubricantis TaxID=2086470 RepID=A0ABW1ITE0_9BACL